MNVNSKKRKKEYLANRMHYPGMTCALFDYEHLVVVWTRLCAIIVVILDE